MTCRINLDVLIDREGSIGDNLMKLVEEFLIEMAKAGEFPANGSRYEVIVHPREREGAVPHSHLHIKGTKYSKDICVKFDSPEYFIHGSYVKMLNTGEKKKLNEFMHSRTKRMVAWDYLAESWDRAYPESPIESFECPNYEDLPDKEN